MDGHMYERTQVSTDGIITRKHNATGPTAWMHRGINSHNSMISYYMCSATIIIYIATLYVLNWYSLGPSLTPGGGIICPSSPMAGFHVGSATWRLFMIGTRNCNAVWPSRRSDRSNRATPYESQCAQPQVLNLSAVFAATAESSLVKNPLNKAIQLPRQHYYRKHTCALHMLH